MNVILFATVHLVSGVFLLKENRLLLMELSISFLFSASSEF